jgi:cytochrome P450
VVFRFQEDHRVRVVHRPRSTVGGDLFETARLSMVGAAHALLEHPDQRQTLKRGDAGIDTAVEEILRWTTPALHSGRTATTDTEVGGHAVKAGEIVTVWNASASAPT